MARPEREKRICREPRFLRFSPVGKKGESTPITLSIEEYETIRWIDLEGASREECALYMDIARTTAQAIYNSARAKIAEALINGRELYVGGGSFRLCNGEAGCKKCCLENDKEYSEPSLSTIPKKEDHVKRVALPYEEGEVFQHFGRSVLFMVFDIDGKETMRKKVYQIQGNGHSFLARMLYESDVDVLVCGGIGSGAMDALSQYPIEVISGASGPVEKALESYLGGELISSGINCSKHGNAIGH